MLPGDKPLHSGGGDVRWETDFADTNSVSYDSTIYDSHDANRL